MKLEQQHIDHIKSAFAKMQTKEDLLLLMNEVKPLVYGEKTVPFKMKQLTWYANPKVSGERYKEFKIKKKSGSERSIHAPVKGLKALQKTLALILQSAYEPHNSAMGFVRGRSIVDNARLHVGSRYVYNIDLKDFFPSIDQARVWKTLQLKPFNLIDKIKHEDLSSGVKYSKAKNADFHYKTNNTVVITFEDGSQALVDIDKGFEKVGEEHKAIFCDSETDELLNNWRIVTLADNKWIVKVEEPLDSISNYFSRRTLASLIAGICCTEMQVDRKNAVGEWEKVTRNVLPQGAPTSPVLTNIVCQKLDFLLTGVAKRFGLKYSRYADDITFSSMHNVYQPDSDFLKELHRLIANQNFYIKESKTRLQKDGYRKEVTGLLVNENVNVQKRYIKQLRMWLYYWENYGYEKAKSFFLQQYVADKGRLFKDKPDMINVISGKLDYLKMVKGAGNELYSKLENRFNNLTKPNQVKLNEEDIQAPQKNNSLKTLINNLKDTIIPNRSIVQNSNLEVEATTKENENIYPIIHNPSKTVELLKYFTANDKDLKYSTHSWEEGKYNSYEEYIENIRLEWDEIRDELKNQSPRLFAKISNYLFNENLGQKGEKGYYIAWGEMKLKFGWSSAELKIHMKEPENSPFSCPIPDHIRELDKKHNLYYFKDYADIFKNEIEFREDSNNFKKMILNLWEKELGYDFNVKGIEQLVGFSFFTDVHLLKEALSIIFRDMFKGKPEFPEVIIEKTSNFESGGYHSIKITQKDSFITRAVHDTKLTSPTGNLHSIIKTLKNLADYSIVSRFGDGSNYRINYLAATKKSFLDSLPENENVIGFTHEFKFYL